MSYLVNKDLIEQAIVVVLPIIKEMMAKGLVKRKDLAIYIYQKDKKDDLECLGFRNIGDNVHWEHPYGNLAFRKARAALRTGVSTEELITRRPYLLETADPIWAGGVLVGDIGIGVSGVEDYFDHMIASMIKEAIIALTKEALIKKVIPDGRN